MRRTNIFRGIRERRTWLRLTALLIAGILLLSGCAASPADTQTASTVTLDDGTVIVTSSGSVVDTDAFSDRDLAGTYDASKAVSILLNGDSAACDGSGVSVSGSTVTITAAGTYLLSGSLEDGSIIIQAGKEDKVQLVLDGVTIHSDTFASIYVASADKVFLTLAEGTVNTLTNGGSFTQIDSNNVDAVIFSKDDLTLNGSGCLVIQSPAGHGVVGKDDVVIAGGSYEITALGQGIRANDSLSVASGSLKITAGKDGLHAENSDDASLGTIYLAGGEYTLTTTGDGISASGSLLIKDGTYTIVAGSTGASSDESQKGIKAGGDLTLLGGSFTVISADDGIHSNASISVTGGSYILSSGDDGIHADATLYISDGEITVNRSYEGLEGKVIQIAGGTVDITASDDGINAGGGNDESGFGGRGGDTFASVEGVSLEITGGEIHVNAEGDGLDSNGTLTISGGTIYVSGPTNSGNGALDANGEKTITGGTLIAAGSSGMTENFTTASQGAILVNVGNQAAGTTVTLTDEDGNVLLTWSPEKTYASVNLSCAELVKGGTYTVTAGTYSTTLTLESLIYGSASGMGGPGGGMGGRGGR